MRPKFSLSVAVLLVLAFSASAWAIPATVVKSKWLDVKTGAGSAVSLYDDDGNKVTGSATNRGGLFRFYDQENYDEDGNREYVTDFRGYAPDYPTTYYAFCIEVVESIGNHNLLPYNVTNLGDAPIDNNNWLFPTMGDVAADKMARLWADHFDDTVTGGHKQRGAFQAAVWELVYDQGVIDLASGHFQMADTGTDSEFDLAKSWLENLGDDKARLVALTWDGRQDFVVEVVPETSSALLWCMIGGVVGVGCWFRRRRQI